MEFVVDGPHGAHVLDVPTIGEVEKLISSDECVYLFRVTKKQLISPEGLGLKVVAPRAGFALRDEDDDGEASLSFYREAVGIVGDPAAARAKLDALKTGTTTLSLTVRDVDGFRPGVDYRLGDVIAWDFRGATPLGFPDWEQGTARLIGWTVKPLDGLVDLELQNITKGGATA